MTLLEEQGIKEGIIFLDEEQKYITYLTQNKKKNYQNPEEKVRADVYLQLVLVYTYNPKHIDFEVVMPARTPNFLADIVVYQDDAKTYPFIVVECKKEEVTEAEFAQAIEQGFGNAISLNAPYLWVSSGIKSRYYNTDKKDFGAMERVQNVIASIPRYGQSKLSKAKLYKGGVDENGNPAFDLKIVKQSELTRIFGTAHQALWGAGKRNEIEALDEFNKLIFCKLWDEKQLRKKGEPYDFQEFTAESPQFLLNRIRAIYNKGREKDPEVFRDDIRLSAEELKTIVGYLSEVNVGETDLDSKGRAFEKFIGSNFRGKFGAYFTPREIVKFIVEALPIKNDSFVLDTSCGSGGFLLYALDTVRRQADEKARQGYFELGGIEHHRYWHDFASKHLYGIEINESSARTAKMNMIIHDDGHTNVVSYDGLANISDIADKTGNKGFKANHFDFIITNPPFGSTVKQTEKAYLGTFFLGKKDMWWIDRFVKNLDQNFDTGTRETQSTEVLFIEQCWRFLKPNGYLAMVIPDGILTNSSSQFVRDWIEEHYRIVGVVSMPQTAFTATGAGVKSSVIFLRKYSADEAQKRKEAAEKLQSKIWQSTKHESEIRRLENEKKRVIATHDGFQPETINWDSPENLELLKGKSLVEITPNERARKKLVESSAEFKAWKKEIGDGFNERLDQEKDALEEEYQRQKQAEQTDYPVFMAIADNIGYDATGKTIQQNDLPEITEELQRFIAAIEKGNDDFFL